MEKIWDLMKKKIYLWGFVKMGFVWVQILCTHTNPITFIQY